MLKINLSALFLIFSSLGAAAQTAQKSIVIDLITVRASETIVLKVLSGYDLLKNYQLNIYNDENQKVRSEALQINTKGNEIRIGINDLEFGKYNCTITKNDVEIFKDFFIKDTFDPL